MANKSFQSIISIAFLAIAAFFFFKVIFFVASGVFTFLGWVAPALLVGALVINHKVVLNYGKFIWNKLMTNPLVGGVYAVGTFFLFPIVATLLLLAAVGSKKMNKLFDLNQMGDMRDQETENAEFEILDDDPPMELDLPEVEIEKKDDSRYDDLF